MNTLRTYSSYQPNYRSDQAYIHGNPIKDQITPEFVIEHYLTGLPLTASINGESLEKIVQQKIDAAVGDFETRLDMFVVPRKILACVVGQQPIIPEIPLDTTGGDLGGFTQGRPAVAGQDYDMLEVPYDYTARRFERWSLIKTRHRPILNIDSILFALPPNFGILAVPQPWIVANPNTGMVQIVPVQGAMAVTSPGAGMWLPFFTMGQMNYVPQFTQIIYTAGIYPLPMDMIDAIAMLAASKVLAVYDTALWPGVRSFTNTAGRFSQQVTMRDRGPFREQIDYYQSEALRYIKFFRNAHGFPSFAQLGRDS